MMDFEGLLDSLGNLPNKLSYKYWWAYDSAEDAKQEMMLSIWKAFATYHGEVEEDLALKALVIKSLYNGIKKQLEYTSRACRSGIEVPLESLGVDHSAIHPTFDERIYLREFVLHLREMLPALEYQVLVEALDGREVARQAYLTSLRKTTTGVRGNLVAPNMRALAATCNIRPGRASSAFVYIHEAIAVAKRRSW